MNECNSLEIDKTKLTEQTKIRVDIISEIENYYHQEINQRKVCIKKLSKYVAAFDYMDKVLVVLVATSGGVSIISSIFGAPIQKQVQVLLYFFSLTARIIKKFLSITRNKKKHDKIFMLANSIASKH